MKRWITLSLIGITEALLALSLLGVTGLALPGGLAAPPTATRTPTPTPTPKSPGSSKSTGLARQLYWAGIGGGYFIEQSACQPEMLERLKRLPGVWTTGRIARTYSYYLTPNDYVGLCLFGLPFEQGFSLKLYRPDGSLAGTESYASGEYEWEIQGWRLPPIGQENAADALAAYFGEIPVIFLPLWAPAGMPAGQWRVAAAAQNRKLDAPIELAPWQAAAMVSDLQPPSYFFPQANPLAVDHSAYLTGQADLGDKTTGNSIRLFGAGFQPGSLTSIGAYRQDADDALLFNLVHQVQAKANGRGEWSASYTLGLKDPPGDYRLIVSLVAGPFEGTGDGRSIGPALAYTVEQWRPCPGSYASLLASGMQAQVIPGQKANRLRAGPTRQADNVTGSLPAGQPFVILDGPQCADGWVWWYVRARDGQRGWTAEGDGAQRFLEPLALDN